MIGDGKKKESNNCVSAHLPAIKLVGKGLRNDVLLVFPEMQEKGGRGKPQLSSLVSRRGKGQGLGKLLCYLWLQCIKKENRRGGISLLSGRPRGERGVLRLL